MMAKQAKTNFVQFRVPPSDYQVLENIAKIVYKNKSIPAPTVSALCRRLRVFANKSGLVLDAKDRAIEESVNRQQQQAQQFMPGNPMFPKF